MKVTMTTNETAPLDILVETGATIITTGSVDDYDWARYDRAGIPCMAVWRTVCIPPDGYDYQVVSGTMDEIGRLLDRQPLGEWARNMAEWDIVQRARYAAMTNEEAESEVTAPSDVW